MALERVNAMTSGELYAAVRSGSGVVSDCFASCDLSGAQLAAFVKERLKQGGTTGITPLMHAGANVDLWAEGSEDKVVTVEFVARRGKDGLLGVDIMDNLSLDIYNVVITIVPGSIAEKDGFFRLGDVITSVDGQPLLLPGESEPRQVKDMVQDGKKQYTVEVIRGGRESVASVKGDAAAGASHASKKFKLTLPPPAGASAPSAGRDRRGTVSVRFEGEFTDTLTAQSPRSQIFEHAAALQRKHERIARARKSISEKRDAEAASQKLAGHRTQSEQALSI